MISYRYSKYLSYLPYNKILDFWWYKELKDKLDLLEKYKIKINIIELNKYLYERMQYERGDILTFNDTKYSIENFMQIIPYKSNGYETDDEYEMQSKQIDFNFINIMNGLAEKLNKFSMKY